MINNCVICGAELVDGKCPNAHGLKPMCLNCEFVRCGDENCYCVNDNVLKTAYDKMMAALPEGFEVDVLTIKPMVLKNPCKKCGNYSLNEAFVVNEMLKELGINREE